MTMVPEQPQTASVPENGRQQDCMLTPRPPPPPRPPSLSRDATIFSPGTPARHRQAASRTASELTILILQQDKWIQVPTFHAHLSNCPLLDWWGLGASCKKHDRLKVAALARLPEQIDLQ